MNELFYDGRVTDKHHQISGNPGIVKMTNGKTEILLEKYSGGRRSTDHLRKGMNLGTVSTIVDVMTAEVLNANPANSL